jgi:predicted lipoprotein with Yx(FWY)xxD motif
LAVLASAALFALAACGGGATATPAVTAAPSAAPAATAAAGGNEVTVATSASDGKYLAGKDGLALYIFKNDSGSTSSCYEGCATAWPPLLVGAGEAATGGDGVGGTFGTTARTDGTTQVTYNARPLLSADTKAGDTTARASMGLVPRRPEPPGTAAAGSSRLRGGRPPAACPKRTDASASGRHPFANVFVQFPPATRRSWHRVARSRGDRCRTAAGGGPCSPSSSAGRSWSAGAPSRHATGHTSRRWRRAVATPAASPQVGSAAAMTIAVPFIGGNRAFNGSPTRASADGSIGNLFITRRCIGATSTRAVPDWPTDSRHQRRGQTITCRLADDVPRRDAGHRRRCRLQYPSSDDHGIFPNADLVGIKALDADGRVPARGPVIRRLGPPRRRDRSEASSGTVRRHPLEGLCRSGPSGRGGRRHLTVLEADAPDCLPRCPGRAILREAGVDRGSPSSRPRAGEPTQLPRAPALMIETFCDQPA